MSASDKPSPARRALAARFRNSRLGTRARDDRGRRVRLLDPARLKDSHALTDPIAGPRLSWARAELRAGTFGLRLSLLMMLYLVVFAILDGAGAPPMVWLTVAPVWLALLWWLNRVLARRGDERRTDRVASMLASHGLCPTCAYSLDDLAPEPDGCTVCPECGGAWKRRAAVPVGPTLPGSPSVAPMGWRRLLPRPMLKDDRREAHPCFRPPQQELLDLAWTEEQRHRLSGALEDACDASRVGRRRLAALHSVLALVYLGLVVWMVTLADRVYSEMDPSFGGGWTILLLILPIGMLAFLAGITALSVTQARRALTARASLSFPKGYACLPRHGFCAACLRDLTGLAPNPDGCTICPECGAAWRLPDAGAQAAQSP